MKIRRTAAVTATVAVLALSLAACGRADTGGTPQGEASELADGPATGTIEVWAMGVEAEALPDLVKDFEADNPDATVKVTAVPWGEASQKIQTAIAAGTTPDMTMIGSESVPEYVGTGGLAPLPDGLVEQDDFNEAAWNNATHEGVQYAVPWYVETRAIFYRKDFAEAAGWTETPQTWDELHDFAGDLQTSGAKWGISLPAGEFNSWQATLPFFWQAGGQVLTDDGTGFELGSESMVEALSYINSFYLDGISDSERAVGEAPMQPQFIDGTYGAYYGGPWEVALLREAGGQEFLDEKVAVAQLPAGPSGDNTGFIGGGSWTVFTDAKNPDGAWKLIQWLSEPEQQEAFFDLTTDLPAVKEAWDYQPLADDPFLSVFGEQLNSTQGPPLISTWLQVGAEMDKYTEQVIRAGLAPEEAAASIQSAAESIGVGE